MTAIFYPDVESTSASGRFTLEARSPDNGAIAHRDGRMGSDDDFGFKYREHQRHFRYRLLDLGGGSAVAPRVVWERFQGDREDSPHELAVADDGWSILRTHGFSPEIIAVGPDGPDAVRIRLVGEGDGDEPPRGEGIDWKLSRMSWTTAGNFWSENSWRGFFRFEGESIFSWRTWWGQRLVIDLRAAVAYTRENPAPPGVFDAAVEAERAGVRRCLADLSGRMGEVADLLGRRGQAQDEAADVDDDRRTLMALIDQAGAAFHLVGIHRMRDCIPFLREWEAPDWPLMSSGSTAMVGKWWLQSQRFRPIVQQSLKRLGEEPRGFATCHFIAGHGSSAERFAMPERIADRQARASGVTTSMSAKEVLRTLGSPDFVRRTSREEGRFYRWSEDWEYDFRSGDTWTTLRMTWEEKGKASRMTAIEAVAPDWLDSLIREEEILPY